MSDKKIRSHIKKLIPKRVFDAIEPPGHFLEAALLTARAGHPAKHLRVIGVTGTNGKTTTSYMIHSILVEAGLPTALQTTVGNGVGHDIKPQIEHMTSVSPGLLQKRLKEFRKAGAKWLVMETTSHALAQHRDFGIPYEIAVITNLTHEHLDYHRTFERYGKAKQRLFRIAARHGKKLGVINADDASADMFADIMPNTMLYGLQRGDIKPTGLKLRPDGSSYTVSIDDRKYNIDCKIPGEFNVLNSLAAVCVGHSLGLPQKAIEDGISRLNYVEGRMNALKLGQAYSAIIDFAHTPDAFERLLSDLRKSTKGRLVAVFGSAGRRDEAKRYTQGEIAGKYCDELILTEEDDRDIDGNHILDQIAEGAERSGKKVDKNVLKILDRPSAIKFAITRVSKPEDTVIFLGKGHEKTIERADGEHPWNETDEVTKAITRKLNDEVRKKKGNY